MRYIAMWSGPRNISTAMMRSFGNRPDTLVVDEPFYAHYLQQTGLPHPGAKTIIASQPTDWPGIVNRLTGPIPGGKTVFYQKHITTHMLDHIPLDWLSRLNNVFLIRDPTRVVASYARARPDLQFEDLGFSRQWRVFHHVRTQIDPSPLVIDAERFLGNPREHLEQICHRLELPFDVAMLHWPPGIRDTDGIWHSHWYAAVARSTGFAPHRPKAPALSVQQRTIADRCQVIYQQMLALALPGRDAS